MNQFIWNLRCMISARKYKLDNEYQWYRYLVLFDIEHFFLRFKFNKKNEDDLPF